MALIAQLPERSTWFQAVESVLKRSSTLFCVLTYHSTMGLLHTGARLLCFQYITIICCIKVSLPHHHLQKKGK